MMTSLLQDLKFALRQLRRAPAFALVAITTLALAIGVSSSIFSVLDATVIRPLPYNDPDQIVQLVTYSPQGYTQPASWPQYVDWRKQNSTFSALAGFDGGSSNMESPSGASPVVTVYGTDNFFDVFQVKPLLGRTFAPGEGSPGHNDVVVLSYELWQQSFGSRSDVVGSTLKIDGTVNTVIGVMPAGFRFPLQSTSALYRPLHKPQTQLQNRGAHFLPTIGRLKPGITLERAQGDLAHVFNDLGRAYPDEAGRRIKLYQLAEITLGDTAAPLRVLTIAVFGVLLIGCINIAGLLLARGVRRQRELSLRSAIGAARSRIVRQLLTESAVLALAGGVAGIALAAILLHLMRALLVHALARGADVHLNLPVLAATFSIAILSGLVAGALPAFQSSRAAPAQALRSGGSAGSNRGQNRLRSGLICAQVAIALCLLVCSGLLLRNLHSLRNTDLGFSPENLLTEDIFVTAADYQGRDIVTSFYQPLLEHVRAIPGVSSVGVIKILPIQSWASNSDISIIGKPPPPPNQETLAENRTITPGVLETIGAHLVRGRMLDPSLDRKDGSLAVTVNQAFARKFFDATEDPVGRQINWGGTKANIVGITSDLRQTLTRPALAEMDISVAQVPPEYALDELTHMILVVRTIVPPETIAGPLRQAMHQVDPAVPFRAPLTMQQVIAEVLTFQRLESWLFGIFAALALVLSLVGIYGMVHHEVELRTRDIGVRMALGSTRGAVVRQILQRVASLLLVGIALGWLLTLALQRVLASVIELHAAHDAVLLATLTVVLALVGLSASLLPARHAATIDPMTALRNE